MSVTERERYVILRNMEHITGTASDDRIAGNENSNRLDGHGGSDHIEGRGGNDEIRLASGTASGGKGRDSYHIYANHTGAEAEVIIEEDYSVSGESSVISLAQQIGQLSSRPVREGDDLVIRVSNTPLVSDGKESAAGDTLIRLHNLYAHPEAVRHSYRLVTSDSYFFEIPLASDWPASSAPLPLYYDASQDSRWKMLQGQKEKELKLEFDLASRQTGYSSRSRTLRRIRLSAPLPDFMQLIWQDSAADDVVWGSDEPDLFDSTSGNDRYAGKGGKDRYVIRYNGVAREVAINNYASQSASQSSDQSANQNSDQSFDQSFDQSASQSARPGEEVRDTLELDCSVAGITLA